MSNLFQDLKVFDGASFLAGPCAATILSDYGADVIKIEPLAGDRHRSIASGHPSEFSWQLGEHSREVLADFGIDAKTIAALEAAGIVVSDSPE